MEKSKINVGVKMQCPQGHIWVETYPKSHPIYGLCPACPQRSNTRGETTRGKAVT